MTLTEAKTPGDRPQRARRSCLAVPGSSERMLEKAPTLPADQVFCDLEDAVAPGAKQEARELVVRALSELDWGAKTRVVRINDCTTRWALEDLTTVVGAAGDRLDCVMVPKVGDAGQVAFVHHVLNQIEMASDWEVGRIGLELQIENAQGLVNCADILAASDRTETLIFGPGDMAAALGMPSLTVGAAQPDYPGDHWHWVLFTILAHARSAGVQAIDGPYARIRDIEGFAEVARRSRLLGFDGKWVLHPTQIEAANEIYGVTQSDFERALDILDAHSHHTENEGRGAAMLGDEMIDEATRKMALATAEKGRQQGLDPRPTPEEVPFAERMAWRTRHLDDGEGDDSGASGDQGARA